MSDDNGIGEQLEAALWNAVDQTKGDTEPCGFYTVFAPWVTNEVPEEELAAVTVASAIFAFRMLRVVLMMSKNSIHDPDDSGVMVPITVTDNEETMRLCEYIQGGVNLEYEELVDWIIDHEPDMAADVLHQAIHLAADVTVNYEDLVNMIVGEEG